MRRRRTTSKRAAITAAATVALVTSLAACSSGPADESADDGSGADPSGSSLSAQPSSLVMAASDSFPQELRALDSVFTGDLDGMVERRVIRFLLVYSNMLYFLDGPVQKGVSYDLAQEFEKFINERMGTGRQKVHVLVIPVARDQLIPALAEGYGDVAAANLTITPGRLADVDFSDPFLRDVREIVVTGPRSPELAGLADLAGQTIHGRQSSSYYEHLLRFNDSLRAAGAEPVKLQIMSDYLEDDELLEMVNAGLIPIVVVDNHMAEFWAQIFDDLTLHQDIAINEGGQIAWAFRKDSPQLQAAINEFVKSHRKGTLKGNILLKRYLRNADWVKGALRDDHVERFKGMADLFQKYAGQYEFDWLMVAAQGYQESRLDQSLRSKAGAIGVMQLLQSTANSVGIPNIYDVENNIHAGVKYLRLIRDQYFDDPGLDDMNRGLFAFAAYNAGPTRISRLRRKADSMGLDSNVWFDNVEMVVAREVGREPVQYVSNIFKYYVAYRLIADRITLQEEAREDFETG
jgi:membrane-bound lytic murein transglycosylase MltF